MNIKMSIKINLDKLNKSNDLYSTISNFSIEELEKIIPFASDKYYNDTPVISDLTFDMLVDFLRLKNPKSKILKQIGAPIKSKDKVKLPYYLGSMDKIKPGSNKLDKWLDEYPPPYYATDKEDGVSGLLYYNLETNLVKLYTRGTATHGMDISILLNYIPSIPSVTTIKKIFSQKQVAFRGELIISKKRFDTKWQDTMKNGRNTVAGLVNSKTINPNIAHDTRFVVYQIIDPIMSISKQLSIVKKLGFDTVYYKKFNTISYEILSEYFLDRREKSKYVIDGIIITNDMLHPINTNGNPEYAFAFKDILEDQKATSVVVNVEWNESKDGYIIPTIIINPVNVGGVTIKRVTGNNAKYIVDNKIGPGAVVEIIRSNDVIPKIERVIKTANVILPDGKDWMWTESGINIVSTNLDSQATKIKSIYHFFSTLDATGLGEKVIERLYDASYDTIEKILKLSVDKVLEIDRFKQKSAENIISNIKKSTTNISIAQLMTASNKLGHGIGYERIKSILEKYPNIITDYKKLSNQQFIDNIKSIDGIDEKISKMFVNNFDDFVSFYNMIKPYITIETKTKKILGTKLKGKKIVLSGFRDIMTNSGSLEEYIINEGGMISNTISSNTNILIIKDNSISSTTKVTKAKALGITILTLDEFIQSFNL